MLSKYIPKRISTYDILEAMTVVDYGCGSGRYIDYFSRKVGSNGRVYAVDISPIAIADVEKLIRSHSLDNVVPFSLAGTEVRCRLV